jgi:hypothetical protein
MNLGINDAVALGKALSDIIEGASFLLHTSRAIFADFLTVPEKVLDTDVCVA